MDGIGKIGTAGKGKLEMSSEEVMMMLSVVAAIAAMPSAFTRENVAELLPGGLVMNLMLDRALDILVEAKALSKSADGVYVSNI